MSNENRMLQILPKLFPTFRTPIHIVELGANDGYHTQQIVRCVQASGRPWRYIAAEPDPRLQPAVPAGVTLFRGAVGRADGPAPLVLSSGQSDEGMRYTGSSSLRPPTPLTFQTWPRMEFKTSAVVDVLTLDTLCAKHGMDWIDFIWCDVQGCEGDVIAGAPIMMPKTSWFFTEYSDGQLYDGQAVFQDLPGLLPDFALFCDMKGDALFVNKSIDTGIRMNVTVPA